jgi:hypothetical protein
MIDHRHCKFHTLNDWLRFCLQAQDATADSTHIDEVQRAVRLLADLLRSDPDGAGLINQWLAMCGDGRWRVATVIGRRNRQAGRDDA